MNNKGTTEEVQAVRTTLNTQSWIKYLDELKEQNYVFKTFDF